MFPPINKEELVLAEADFECGRRGHELCSLHTLSEIKEAAVRVQHATVVARRIPDPTKWTEVTTATPSPMTATPRRDVLAWAMRPSGAIP